MDSLPPWNDHVRLVKNRLNWNKYMDAEGDDGGRKKHYHRDNSSLIVGTDNSYVLSDALGSTDPEDRTCENTVDVHTGKRLGDDLAVLTKDATDPHDRSLCYNRSSIEQQAALAYRRGEESLVTLQKEGDGDLNAQFEPYKYLNHSKARGGGRTEPAALARKALNAREAREATEERQAYKPVWDDPWGGVTEGGHEQAEKTPDRFYSAVDPDEKRADTLAAARAEHKRAMHRLRKKANEPSAYMKWRNANQSPKRNSMLPADVQGLRSLGMSPRQGHWDDKTLSAADAQRLRHKKMDSEMARLEKHLEHGRPDYLSPVLSREAREWDKGYYDRREALMENPNVPMHNSRKLSDAEAAEKARWEHDEEEQHRLSERMKQGLNQ